ncbi:hypothetical protein SBA6_490028 [Candidatus Sulfopaludibacter sp. SbA6]|nr:hypothetical protein SBA6_490028 [Candidatus Sulfopaludibacter sp. SbA6]
MSRQCGLYGARFTIGPHMGKLMLSLILGAVAVPAADNVATLRPSRVPVESVSIPSNSGMTLWRASVAALAATNVMDVQSSWGKRELNPALVGSGGAFGARGRCSRRGLPEEWSRWSFWSCATAHRRGYPGRWR